MRAHEAARERARAAERAAAEQHAAGGRTRRPEDDAPPEAPADPAHAPIGEDGPNPGDPGPPVLEPGRADPLCDPRLPAPPPPQRGV